MNLLELVELLELDNLKKTSYASPLKLVAIGKTLNFNSNTRVIDFGCGRGSALKLWGEYFDVSGEGIEQYEPYCKQAREKLKKNQLFSQIKIKCEDASNYKYDEGSFDVASCLGSSMIWGGFQSTLNNIKKAIGKDGTIIIGEPYFTNKRVPQELIELEGKCHTESEILSIIRKEGFKLEFVRRASIDDKDNYRAHFEGDLQESAIKYMKDYYYGWGIYVMKGCES